MDVGCIVISVVVQRQSKFDSSSPATTSSVFSFATLGFSVCGSYMHDGGPIRLVVSGYTLKSGFRVSQSGEGAFPGGSYDRTFRDDYEYTSAGDLDECNGMTVDGQYGYYITSDFPYAMNCFKGTLDSSFLKM
ncbi:MAG: YHYH protein [Bdellovibrionales bacterium]